MESEEIIFTGLMSLLILFLVVTAMEMGCYVDKAQTQGTVIDKHFTGGSTNVGVSSSGDIVMTAESNEYHLEIETVAGDMELIEVNKTDWLRINTGTTIPLIQTKGKLLGTIHYKVDYKR